MTPFEAVLAARRPKHVLTASDLTYAIYRTHAITSRDHVKLLIIPYGKKVAINTFSRLDLAMGLIIPYLSKERYIVDLNDPTSLATLENVIATCKRQYRERYEPQADIRRRSEEASCR